MQTPPEAPSSAIHVGTSLGTIAALLYIATEKITKYYRSKEGNDRRSNSVTKTDVVEIKGMLKALQQELVYQKEKIEEHAGAIKRNEEDNREARHKLVEAVQAIAVDLGNIKGRLGIR